MDQNVKPRYWVVAPYDSTKADIFESAWSYDKSHGTIAIGWSELLNISNIATKDELSAKFIQTYKETTNKGSITRDVNTLWNFLHEVKRGDIIIARKGTKKAIGYGIVKGEPFYDVIAGKERIGNVPNVYYYPNFIPVEWQATEKTYPNIVFSFYTMYEIPEDRYNELDLAPPPTNKDELESSEEPQKVEFVLEKYLEDFIVSNFETIFSGKLILHKDQDGGIAQQFPIVSNGKQIGRIDILARDSDLKNYTVIELKKGRESDQVVGQLLRYMGWVKENLCDPDQEVNGLIICREVDERLTYAVSPIASIVKIKLYKIDFQLMDKLYD